MRAPDLTLSRRLSRLVQARPPVFALALALGTMLVLGAWLLGLHGELAWLGLSWVIVLAACWWIARIDRRARGAQEAQSLDADRLREREALLAAIFEAVPDALFVKDLKGRYVMANAAAARWLGRTPEQVIGHEDIELFGPVSGNEIIAIDRQALAAPMYYEATRQYPQGVRTMRTGKSALRGADGTVRGIVGVSHDITERIAAERALAEREQQLRVLTAELEQRVAERTATLAAREALLQLVTENIPVMIGRYDRDRRLVFANAAYARALGATSAAELIGRRGSEFLPPERLALNDPYTRRAYAGETVQYVLPGRHDPQRCVLITLTPEIDAQGQQQGIFATIVDITDRLRTEEGLRRSEAKLRERERELELVTGHVPAYIVRFDENRICRYANPMWAAAVGVDPEQAVGRHFAQLVGAERAAQQEAAICGVLAGQAQQYEAPRVDRPGGAVVATLLPYRKEDGSCGGWFAFAIDITERKAAEAALRQSNADLEQFAYGVSHDLRAPLRAISGHLQLLAQSCGGQLDTDALAHLQFSLGGAKRLDEMIVALLEYSRIGRQEVRREAFDTRLLADEALGFLAPTIAERGACIEITGQWPRWQGSRPELSRVLQNLLANALKFQVPGRPPRIQVGSSVRGGRWCVEVVDDGVGFEPSQASRLFALFSRLHARSDFDGSGMGLALCRRVVERHGGVIWAESAGIGQGSRFGFELPGEATA